MPQMAVGGLSESWLFRELGDMHWTAICEALETRSDAIADEQGNRLYATFVRFRWEGSASLQAFRENDDLVLENSLTRFGGAMYFSRATVTGPSASISASLMTTFASRESTNTGLLKGQPSGEGATQVPVEPELPDLAAEYRRIRKGEQVSIALCEQQLVTRTDVVVGRQAHEINPYQDFNGVNLLYFAAYPSIADQGERLVVHSGPSSPELDWALATSTLGRDIMYFGNCEIDDVIDYDLHALAEPLDHRTASVASMRRRSDGARICAVLTVKDRHR